MYQVILDDAICVPGMICGIHTQWGITNAPIIDWALVHTFGNQVNFHPHVHAIASLGVFDARGAFYRVDHVPDEGKLAELFRYKVLKMLTERDKIDEVVIESLMNFNHTGFVLIPNL